MTARCSVSNRSSAFSILLNPEEDAAYRSVGFRFIVAGWVDFTDAFDRIQAQPFGRVCSCRNGSETTWEPYEGSLTGLLKHLQRQIPPMPIDPFSRIPKDEQHD
jgi:hypothetical protein